MDKVRLWRDQTYNLDDGLDRANLIRADGANAVLACVDAGRFSTAIPRVEHGSGSHHPLSQHDR